MSQRLSDEELRHPLKEELLDQASKIKGETELLRERLQKLDSHREGVSSSVYQRVRSDYLTKLDGVAQKFQALRQDLDSELVALTEKKILIEGNLKHQMEEVEEAKLRQSLGEYLQGDYEKLAKQKGEEIKRLEGALKIVEGNLARFQEILKIQDLSVPAKKPSSPKPTGSVTEKPLESTSKVELKPKQDLIPQLIVTEDGKTTTILIEKNLQIGRSPANDVVLKDAKVSRQHAQIQIVGGKHVLMDMESSNGTFVGGKKITEHTLRPGDEVRIGKATMVFKV